MQLRLRATFNDGSTNEVTTNLMVIVSWERKFKRKASEMAQGVGVEDLAYLCYEATRLTGQTVPTNLDTFISLLASIEVVEQADPKA
jgi:hypothetical protein